MNSKLTNKPGDRKMAEKLLTDEESDIFSDSLTRCLGNSQFLERFYNLFLESSAEVREKFKNTDWQKQQRMIKASFHMLMLSADAQPEGQMHLQRIADRHSHHDLNIPSHLYDLWFECLMIAVREFDPQFTEKTDLVWQKVMQRGIEFMRSHY